MAFDWLQFLQHHGIPHRTSGKNVKRGWVNVQCPFCGSADTDMHMGINPASAGFSCWRDPTHRSYNVPKLIKALLGCDWGKACALAGDWKEPGPADLDDLYKQARELDSKGTVRQLFLPRTVRDYPCDAFRKIREDGPTQWHFRYLVSRGYHEPDVCHLCQQYRIRGATSGEWRNRVILPFLGPGLKVYGWQGRAISQARLRYVSHPDSSAVKNLLFNFGPAADADDKRVLVVVEGPLDALKVDYYGQRHGIRAVGTLGTSFTAAQVNALFRLAPEYERVLILFDPDAESAAYDLASKLSFFNPVVGAVPDGVEDPGALEPSQVRYVVDGMLESTEGT